MKSSRRWRRLRLSVQVLMLVLFLYLFLGTQQEYVTFLPPDLFFHLDPLAGLSALLAGRRWIPQMALGAVTLLLALVVGRAWCGWLCPLGTLLDWIPGRRPHRNEPDIPSYWRQAKHFLFFAILFAALFGSLTLLVLDPITLLFRTLGSVVLPGFSSVVTGAETWLYRIGPLQPAVEGFDRVTRGFLLTEQPFFLPNLILGAVFAAVLALNAVRPRFWCRYLCPLGALLGLISRVPLIRHKVDEDGCVACQRCSLLCPTGAIDPEHKFKASPAECTTCLDCVETCPTGAITFGLRRAPGLLYDPSRRQFLASLGAAAVGAALLRITPAFLRTQSQLVRPPGTSEEQLLNRCIRCGECARVCPTGAIQPSSSAADWEGLWTPRLMMRLGYCDYSCNSCGQVCSTGAIPALSLAEKRQAIIGLAVIDRQRCIPWAEGRDCIVCEEMCPVPQKAIRLTERRVRNQLGVLTRVRLPRVLQHPCTGCGICEYQCPVAGEAAIRIYPIISRSPHGPQNRITESV